MIVRTQREVAEFFDVGLSTVRKWAEQEMPGRPGRYDLARVARWLFATGPWRSSTARDEMLARAVEGPPTSDEEAE